MAKELAGLKEDLRRNCADLGLLVCKSQIPNWRIIKLHYKWDPQRFCSHLDEISMHFGKDSPISTVSTSLQLKQYISGFQQFKKDLTAEAVTPSDRQLLGTSMRLVSSSLLLYTREFIRRLKRLQLHYDSRLKNWITDFELMNPEQKDSAVPITAREESTTRRGAPDTLEVPAPKKHKVWTVESPGGETEKIYCTCVQPTEVNVSKGCSDEESKDESRLSC